MSYKIYSYSEKYTLDISSFKLFKIQQYNRNEFIISNQKQKFCVNLAEIFEFCQNKYFIFDDKKVNFLLSSENSKKIFISLNNLKNLKCDSKFYLSLLLAAMLVFYLQKLNILDV